MIIMTNLYPLKLTRHLSSRLWGGKKLESFLKLSEPFNESEPLGESWQVYHNNNIVNGELAGKTLAEVAKTFGEDLLGTKSFKLYGNTVPLLAKFIDAADKLSIQVHPDDAYARRVEAHTGHLGKTEAWYVLEAEENAQIIWGFKQNVTKNTLCKAIGQGTLEEYVNFVPVKAGDVIFNPAGTLHAIGAGIFLFEIQQSSDLTYRVYDYQRCGANGELRELHVGKALDVLDLAEGEQSKVTSKHLSDQKSLLVSCDAFAMESWQVLEEQESTDSSSLDILTLTKGELLLQTQNHEIKLVTGESVLLPASLGKYSLVGKADVLRCYVP